jgi:hypothetical protein
LPEIIQAPLSGGQQKFVLKEVLIHGDSGFLAVYRVHSDNCRDADLQQHPEGKKNPTGAQDNFAPPALNSYG